MEADFTEVEVTSIPKSQHRLITGVKGATVKALRKEFGCEIEIPEEKSRHSTIIVGGPAAKVKLCIAKIEALASADRNASAVSPPAVVVKGKGQKVSAQTAAPAILCAAAGNKTNSAQSSTTTEAPAKRSSGSSHRATQSTACAETVEGASTLTPIDKPNANPNLSSGGATNAPLAAITYAFNFEKAAHAKLKGPRDSKKAEYEALLLARLSAPQNNSTESFSPPPSSSPSSLSSGTLGFTVSAVSIDFPPPDDLTNTTIAVRAYGPAARVHSLSSLQKSDCEEHIRRAVTALLEERRLFHHTREGTAIREVPFGPLPPPTNTTTTTLTPPAAISSNTACPSPPAAVSSNTACPSPHNEKTKAQELSSAKKASGNTNKNLAAANNNNKNVSNNDTTTNSGGGDDQREDGESKDLNGKGMGRRNTNNNNNTSTKAGGGAGQRRKEHEGSTPAPKTTPTAAPATTDSASSAATEGGEAKVAANEGSSLSELSSQAHTQRRDGGDGNDDDGATQKPHAAAVGGKNRGRRGRGGQGKKGTEAEAEDATAETNKTAEASSSQKIVDTTAQKRGVGDVGDAVWKNLYRFPLHPYDAKNTLTATSTAILPTDILAMMGAPPQRAMFA